MSDILDQAKDHYKIAKDGWQEINQKALADLHFLSDEPYAQWDSQEAARRTTVGRPTVEIDQLSQFVHQVANDIRQNTPAIHVIPDGDGSDLETAEIIQGRIKAIEYKSNADAAYDIAADFAVRASLGYIRVDHGYVNDNGFEQELRIKRVINPQAILLDPNSIEPDGSDAKYGFVLEDMTCRDFKKKYPKAVPVSFGEEKANKTPQDHETITIAEYFYIEETDEEWGLLDSGKSERVTEGGKYKSTRNISKRKVHRCKLSGEDELKKTTFPGKYIPIVPVYGEEAWIEGKRNLYSLIRKSKSAQMMYNALKSSEIEILMKQQQAPVQAAVGQMRGFEDDWKQPDKAMVLYYHQTDATGQQAPPPVRLQPPTVSAGFANASVDAENNIRKTMGMYNAGVGKREGDASGVALKQLEMSGDTAALHFGDNLIRSVTHVGKIIVCALPEIEDTPRAVSIIGQEDEMKTIGINGHMVEGQKRLYDFRKGNYDVRVIAGPSFTTQRQEAAAMYSDVVGKMPDLMPIIGDLVFKYQDAPGAQAISSRLKKLVDPKLLDESERDDDSGVNPEVEQLKQEATQVIQAAQAQIQEMQAKITALEADKNNKQADAQIKAGDLQLKEQELALKERELNLKEAEAIAKYKLENKKLDMELTQARLTAKTTANPDVAMTDADMNGGESPIIAMIGQITQALANQEAGLSQGLQQIAQGQQVMAEAFVRGNSTLAAALNRPKSVVMNGDAIVGIQ